MHAALPWSVFQTFPALNYACNMINREMHGQLFIYNGLWAAFMFLQQQIYTTYTSSMPSPPFWYSALVQSSQLHFVWSLGWEDPTARDLRGSTVWLSKPWFHQRATRADVLIKNAGCESEGDCLFQSEPGWRFKALIPLTCEGSQVSMPIHHLKYVASTNTH